MTFATALAAIGVKRQDPDALADLASLALAEGEEAVAAPLLDRAARVARSNARLFQWSGLLHRSLDQMESALEAFDAAARIAPDDALIAHGRARVALEAGLDARPHYEAALRLEPSGDVLLGRAAARFAMGEGEQAAGELAAILESNPQWVAGHVQWAQLASMIGQGPAATRTIDRAVVMRPKDEALWLASIEILTKASRHAEAWRVSEQAQEIIGKSETLALRHAAALSDAGDNRRAAEDFAALGDPAAVDHAIHLARHRVRVKDWDGLTDLSDRWMSGDDAHHFWPYASIGWRHSRDPRWHWLEGDDRLIWVTDLTPHLPPLDRLADRLRSLHEGTGRFLDQSVRGGTQTDGPLLSRIDPEIRVLRKAIVEAVETYCDQLPPIDPSHPMLRFTRDKRVRFAGSWSVRLLGSGYHTHHVHPQGWISSAFYAAVPSSLDREEGQLTLGEPQSELGAPVGPIRRIEPKAGRLVLFPSMMWHGTLPFTSGERLTVAFDVAPPR